jgi:hypothetical protein
LCGEALKSWEFVFTHHISSTSLPVLFKHSELLLQWQLIQETSQHLSVFQSLLVMQSVTELRKLWTLYANSQVCSTFTDYMQVEKFVEEECIPADLVYFSQLGEGDKRWSTYPSVIDDLKAKAKKLGLWNMFLPKNHFKEGAGFSNLEYGLMAEILGKSRSASEACNCAAPDTGNMEVIAKYGNDAQKRQWLAPLLDGSIRSAFLMTEPDIASSDATNIQLTMTREGNEYVLNGSVSSLSKIPWVHTNIVEMVVFWCW